MEKIEKKICFIHFFYLVTVILITNDSNWETPFCRRYCINIQTVLGNIGYDGSKILRQVYVLKLFSWVKIHFFIQINIWNMKKSNFLRAQNSLSNFCYFPVNWICSEASYFIRTLLTRSIDFIWVRDIFRYPYSSFLVIWKLCTEHL